MSNQEKLTSKQKRLVAESIIMNINYASDVQGGLSEYDEIEIIEKVLQGYDMTQAEPVNVIITDDQGLIGRSDPDFD